MCFERQHSRPRRERYWFDFEDNVGDGAVAMSNLGIEDRLRDLDFLHRFRRRSKSRVRNAGETLRGSFEMPSRVSRLWPPFPSLLI